jgi:short-subunit dehydrogenase
MDLKLSGRTALITGSSKGIGLSVAQWFAREGVQVCLVARSADRLEKEAAAIRATGVAVRTLAADLADGDARARVAAAFADVDILGNNAGAIPGGSIDDVDEPAWRTGWDLKVYGYIGLTRLYLQKMKARRGGVIINIIGAGGERLDFGYIAGAAGNAGLMAFTATRTAGGRPLRRCPLAGRRHATRSRPASCSWRPIFVPTPAAPSSPSTAA